MKPQPAASKLIVKVEMATVREGPQRFNQSWIPPGKTTSSEGQDAAIEVEPWLREYAYIYSGRGLDLTDEVCHPPPLEVNRTEPNHRYGPNQIHAFGRPDKPDTRLSGLDGTTTVDEDLNISVKPEGLSYYSTAVQKDVPNQSALRLPCDLPPEVTMGPRRPPEPPPKRQHSGSSESVSNTAMPYPSYANGTVNSRKPKKKKRFIGWMRGKKIAGRQDGMDKSSGLENDPLHDCGDDRDMSIEPSELRHGSNETLRPSDSGPRQSISNFFSKTKASLARSRNGGPTSDENRKDSKAGRDSHTTARSLSSRLKQHVVEPLAKFTRHGSKDSHKPLSNSSPLPSSNHNTDLSIQHCLASSSSTLEHTTPSSTSTIYSHTAFRKHGYCGLNIQVIPEGPPRPFQCTFCLEQCGNKSDWMEHEKSHFPNQGWTCMINSQARIQYDGRILCDFCGFVDKTHCFSQHNMDICANRRLESRTFIIESDMKHHLLTNHSHDNSMTKDMQSWEWPTCMDNWFWYCGFCDSVLLSWDERQDHIADEHFENKCTMASWNPLTSPYPWSKQSSTLVRGFPRWEQSTLLAAIRQPTILDFVNRVGETRPRNQCRLCKVAFSTFDDLSRHMAQWHDHPGSWSCPTPAKGSTFKDFFEPDGGDTDNSAIADSDVCLYCGKMFSNNPPNWGLRKRHLEEDHHFNECVHEKFFKQDQFCRHLANSHNVEIDYMKDFILSCWREDDRTPATGLVSG